MEDLCGFHIIMRSIPHVTLHIIPVAPGILNHPDHVGALQGFKDLFRFIQVFAGLGIITEIQVGVTKQVMGPGNTGRIIDPLTELQSLAGIGQCFIGIVVTNIIPQVHQQFHLVGILPAAG